MKTIRLYFREQPATNRFFAGDRYIIPALKKLIKGTKVSGVKKVFINLCKGFDELNIDYTINTPFNLIGPGEPVVVLGDGKYALAGYDRPNPIIAGIALMTHPAEWPHLFKEYPVAKYLQHCNWANDIYIPYYGKNNCDTWAAGIDTDHWTPTGAGTKKYDFLIYDKIRWAETGGNLLELAKDALQARGLSYTIIKYGSYKESDYFKALQQSRAMLFLCEHESQGFACCEALSANVPVFAWDQGRWLDLNRFKWNAPDVATTSVPFFDARCGMRFTGAEDMERNMDAFWEKVTMGAFNPRAYVLENLTLQKSAERMLSIIKEVYK